MNPPSFSHHPLGTLASFEDGTRLVFEGDPQTVANALTSRLAPVSSVGVVRLKSSAPGPADPARLIGRVVDARNEGSAAAPRFTATCTEDTLVVVEFSCPAEDCRRPLYPVYKDGGRKEVVCACGRKLPLELVHPG